jgi:hypothetical protein
MMEGMFLCTSVFAVLIGLSGIVQGNRGKRHADSLLTWAGRIAHSFQISRLRPDSGACSSMPP